MGQKALQKIVSATLITLFTVATFSQGYAAPTLKLTVSPDQTEFLTGDDPVSLTTRASGSNLEYEWKIDGPGKIEGSGPAVLYEIPESLDGESAEVTITVVVKDDSGEEATESTSFTILQAKKEGMSTPMKVGLGVGAAALVGGGIALAVGGDDDDDDNTSFTGTFRNEFDKTANDDVTPMHLVNTFYLTQSGDTITGNLETIATFGTCCTAGLTSPITGTVNGTIATLTWSYTESTCEGTDCSWTIYTSGGSYQAELINNGKVLDVEYYGENARQKLIEGNAANVLAGSGNYTRQ